MVSRAEHQFPDTAETIDEEEVMHGMTDAMLDLKLEGVVTSDEVKHWFNTGEMSETARTALGHNAIQA
jgi:hypothetical protein